MRQRLARLRLGFRDPALEAAYREDRFQLNLGNVRFALLAGIRFGVFIPMLVIGCPFTHTRVFGRVWEWTSFDGVPTQT